MTIHMENLFNGDKALGKLQVELKHYVDIVYTRISTNGILFFSTLIFWKSNNFFFNFLLGNIFKP